METNNTATHTEWTDELDTPTKLNDFWKQTDNAPEKVRFVGRALSYKTHYMETLKRTINCAGLGCVLCVNGVKSQNKFISVVYNHTQDRPAIFTFGVEVKGQVKDIVGVWGDPSGYALTLTRTNNGRYKTTVVNNPPTALTVQEKNKLAEFTSRVGDLSRFTVAPDAAEVEALTGLRANTNTDTVSSVFTSSKPRSNGATSKLSQSKANFELDKELGKI